MSSRPSIGLFAGLARKALQATAIRPRLPSRYEGVAAGPFDAAAWTSHSDGHGGQEAQEAQAAVAQHAPWPAGAVTPGARAPTMAERALTVLEAAAAQADAAQARIPRRSPPPSVLGARVQALGAHSGVKRLDSALLPPFEPPHPLADASAVRPKPAAALLPVTQPAPFTREPALPSPAGVSEPARRASAPSNWAADPALSLRARIAQQVSRLQDEPGTASRGLLPAGADATAAPVLSPNAAPTAPRVDITIGSIAIVLTPAPAASVTRAAPPAAGPAVQSLDAYLLARQRRGAR